MGETKKTKGQIPSLLFGGPLLGSSQLKPVDAGHAWLMDNVHSLNVVWPVFTTYLTRHVLP